MALLKEWMVTRAVIERSVTCTRTQLVRRDSRATLRAFIGTYDEMLDRWQRFNVSQVIPADRDREDQEMGS